MTTCDLRHCILTFQRSFEVIGLCWPHNTNSGWFGGLGLFWGPETEHVINFSNGHVHCASLRYPISIRAIDSLCAQAILPMMVTLFLSGMLCVSNIPSRNCNDTLFLFRIERETRWWKLFVATIYTFLKYTHIKLKNCRLCENLSFDLSKLAQILT